MNDEFWMKHAINLAKKAEKNGEVPVGAVLVYEGEMIAEGWNQPIQAKDPSAHAEIICIRQGALFLDNYRLLNTSLYVTLEPCAMCAGAMIHARIERLIYGASDPKTGACGSLLNLVQDSRLNHQLKIEKGLLAEECGNVLRDFFRSRR